MSLNVFFFENMITCIVNDTEKIWIVLIGARLFVYSNDLYIVYEQHIISGHLTQLGILLDVRYLATSLDDPVIFVSITKGFINTN